MEVQFKRHVRVICDLAIGDKVRTDGFGPNLDGKDWEIEDIRENIGGCESGFQVKINGYKNYLDSNWLIKI